MASPFPRVIVHSQTEERIQKFITSLRRQTSASPFSLAIETAEIARQVVQTTKWTNATEMMRIVKQVGIRLIGVAPHQLCVGNVILRVLRLIRDEYQLQEKFSKDASKPLYSSGMFQVLSTSVESDFTKPIDVRGHVLSTLTELIDELKGLFADISKQALEHIHADEVILTFGTSKTVTEFLKEAAQIRKFEVFVPEGAPSYSGHKTAAALSKAGVNVTVISDTAIFAMMARVNKVIVGTHAVMANGGLIAECGTRIIAQAAQHHSVPFVVCVGVYKLCPIYPSGPQTFNVFNSPSAVLNFEEADIKSSNQVNVLNPAFDYVPPELVSLFVTNHQFTNSGSHNPSYIYRLLDEFYSQEDFDMFNSIDSMK